MSCKCHSPEKEKEIPLCVICDAKLFGRSDKRFCTTKCKNKYHAELRKNNRSVSRETLKVLFKNYQVLNSLLAENCSRYRVSKLLLQRKGFDFETVTGIEYNKNGLKLKVFNFFWYPGKNSVIVVGQNPDESPASPFVYKRLKRFGPEEIAA
ncbi:MAG: hypothetical protein K0R65_2964 [Crocinitomicaceae bacterium]|jgi:hypothetical protein|nr:hypothetical protein [Crocinitomicaceae bacterium]